MAITTETKPEGPTCDPNGNIEVSSKLPSRSDLAKVADLPVLDASGKSHTFKSLYANHDRRKTLIIFIRHFFCGNCQEYLKTLSSAITPEALQTLSIPTQLVIIGCGESSLISWYTKETACPFTIYADPTKKLYDLLGMTRTLSLGSKHPEYMKSSVPMNTIKSFWQTLRAGRDMMKGGDFYQVGGEFMFEDERVTWCHRMRNTRDHAEIAEMRKVLGLDGGLDAPRRKRWSTGLGRSLSERRQSWSRSRSRQSKGSRPASVVMGKVTEEQGEDGVKTSGNARNGVVSKVDGGASEAANGTAEDTANGHAVVLAILGEASILSNAQVSTNSRFFLLPRLLPAPQALIRISRPERLVPSTGKVLGAHSGVIKDHVNHIAHLLHDGDHLPAYSVRCERITKNPDQPTVQATLFGPLTWLSILGCTMSIAIFVLAIIKNDGMALLAVILLSVVSTIIGIGSRWSLELKKRKSTREVPVSDVVINYPQGAFMIVKCDEDVARELYWHPEQCIYHVGPTTYRLISLTATLLLMFAVIFLSNAQLPLQLCFAAAYIILNAAYWTAAALPQRWNWDLSRFHTERVAFTGGEHCEAYTEALWKAIAITRSIEWVQNGNIAPRSLAWKEWLGKADEMARLEAPVVAKLDGCIVLPEWDCDAALTEFLNLDLAAKNV